MSKGFVRQQLTRRHRRLLLLGSFLLGLLLVLSAAAGLTILATGKKVDDPTPLVMVALLLILPLIALVQAVRGLRRARRYPTVLALARYGPVAEVVAAIDAEVAQREDVTRLGGLPRSFQLRLGRGELHGAEVLLTPSWLVLLVGEDGTHLDFMHLDSLVWAFRQRPLGVALVNGVEVVHAVLIDRHGAVLQVAGTGAGVTRLLQEVQLRVPWVLNNFDALAQRAWHADRAPFLAEVERRRAEGIRTEDPTDPENTP
jgi:hypothetical protein